MKSRGARPRESTRDLGHAQGVNTVDGGREARRHRPPGGVASRHESNAYVGEGTPPSGAPTSRPVAAPLRASKDTGFRRAGPPCPPRDWPGGDAVRARPDCSSAAAGVAVGHRTVDLDAPEPVVLREMPETGAERKSDDGGVVRIRRCHSGARGLPGCAKGRPGPARRRGPRTWSVSAARVEAATDHLHDVVRCPRKHCRAHGEVTQAVALHHAGEPVHG